MIFELFKNITNYDIESFLDNYIHFIENEYNDIEAFFSGKRADLDRNSVQVFNNIKTQCQEILSLFSLYKESFKKGEFIDLLINIEDINERLNSIDNLPRWYRTNVSLSSYSNTVNVDYILGQNQTIEGIINSYNGTENDFYKVSINNNAIEENVIDGFKVNLQLNKSIGNNIDSVIDSLNNESMYGLDLNSEIQIVDSDLLTLNHTDTIIQLIRILIGLKINDNPDSPSDGVNPSLMIGNPIKTVNAPIVLRQITSVFNQEDVIKSISLSRKEQVEDAAFFYFSVETKLGQNFVEKLSL